MRGSCAQAGPARWPKHNLAVTSPPEPRAAILLYHRVASLSSDRWRMAVSAARFAEQLDVIATRFAPLPLNELASAILAEDVPHGAVALTFDDGYRDVLLAAKPQLERRGIPATVFVISGY